MGSIQLYWQLLVDIIMKVIAFFKKDKAETDGIDDTDIGSEEFGTAEKK